MTIHYRDNGRPQDPHHLLKTRRIQQYKAEDMIADAVERVMGELDPGGDWRDPANQCAEQILKTLIEDNAPLLWESCIDEGTEHETWYISYDSTRRKHPDKALYPGIIPPEIQQLISEGLIKEVGLDGCAARVFTYDDGSSDRFLSIHVDADWEEENNSFTLMVGEDGRTERAFDTAALVVQAYRAELQAQLMFRDKHVLEKIAAVLWYDDDGNPDPDQPWSPDTIEEIANILSGAGYRPGDES